MDRPVPRPVALRWIGVVLAGAGALALASCGGSPPAPSGPPPETPMPALPSLADRQADVAADSSFFVYVAEGPRLVRVETGTGRATELSPSSALDLSPRISPDGTRIAFHRADEGLMTLGADGTPGAVLAPEVDVNVPPAWDPAGERLLCTTPEGSLLLVAAGAAAGADGGPAAIDVRELGWALPDTVRDPWWAADGSVYFAGTVAGQSDLFILDPQDPGTSERLTETPWNETQPCLRDGVLVYASDEDGVNRVYAARLGRGGLTTPVPVSPPGVMAADPVVWPGGGSVLYSRTLDWAIELHELGGGEASTVVPAEARNYWPVFGPGGRDLFYTSDADGNLDIYVVDLDDLTVANLTTNPEDDFEADYCPAAERLVFVTVREGNAEIMSLDESGLDELLLAPHPAADSHPRFSPDGTQVAFVSERGGVYADLWVVDAGGGEPRRLTELDALMGPPAWIDGGATLVFETWRDGRLGLWTVSVEGGEPEPLLPGFPEGSNDLSPRVSPDGGRIAFTRAWGQDADIWILDLATGLAEPVVVDPARRDWNPAFSPDGRTLAYQSGGAWRVMRRGL